MTHHEHGWTLEECLAAAVEMLGKHFGEVDQEAAVSLAGLVYTTSARDTFLREHPAEGSQAYP